MVKADKGFDTYRYQGPYGAIFVGANSTDEALREAAQSLCSGETPDVGLLERWNGEQWLRAGLGA